MKNSLAYNYQKGAWEIWLHFFVGSISHAARDAIELCNDFLAVRARHLAALKGNNRRDDIDQRKLEKLLDILSISSLSLSSSLG